MVGYRNIVADKREEPNRPKQRSWSVFIYKPDKKKNKPKLRLWHSHNFLEDADKPLDKVAEDFYENNYKAGRQFSFDVIDNECLWMLHYPNINRTITGVIRKGAATGRGVKSHG